ncbi:MAG: NADH-quinone oxidoreductase subunit L [Desulfarculus sp.]|nr:NADH-quinone oxidoreductase subunit L [Desulfarculus sp.]
MGLPLLSFFLVFFVTRPWVNLSCAVSLVCSGLPLSAAVWLLAGHWRMEAPILWQLTWMEGGGALVTFGFLLDPLSLLMLVIVTAVSFLVQVYSLGYMAGDPGKAKYYAFLSLFAWSMISLVLASGLMQLYIFWELVGLSSYLLIGFWHHKFSASQAGKKAFVMTRLGDLGFFLGIIVLLLNLGDLSILGLNQQAAARLTPGLLTASALLIFCGVVGKSAQFPLLTWLPDAMEGPTPVSALLHSATMVAAGVYLVSRLFPFYQGSPQALGWVLVIGTVTMLLSSTMAMVAEDIKQVWAYSTVSQLGFMLMGLGAGGYFAGVYHLATHAAFKALLFLCSGVFIHQYATNDFFAMARAGARGLKVPMLTLTLAGAALSGVWPLAGFFSKETVLAALAELPNPAWLWLGILGAGLTAYYTFRLLFVMWRPRRLEPPPEHGERAGHGAHEGHGAAVYWVMAAPLLVLAALTVLLGAAGPALQSFLAWGRPLPAGAHHTWLVWASVLVVATGAGLAWLEFGRAGAAQQGFLSRMPGLWNLFANRWYLDWLYRWLLDHVVYGLFSRLFTLNDRRVVDGGIDGFCRATLGAGWLFSLLQSGLLQYNLFTMVLVMALVGLYFLLV